MSNIPTPEIKDLANARRDISNIQFVAAGGFKAVYKAEIKGQTEAVKLAYLPPEQEEDDRAEIEARVKREINVLRLCETDCLVHLGSIELTQIRIGAHDYFIYSEEFIAGETLMQRIKQKDKPSFSQLKFLSCCLMKSLSVIDKAGHIHRDVKPGNIMVTDNSKRPFVLLDLGIAYKVHGTELTRKGEHPGTTYYMAPELFSPNYRDVLDIRSDIYSAGITIYEYASGEHPLARQGENIGTTINRILNQQPRKLKELRADLPDSFCELVDRCIKKLPALRYSRPAIVSNIMEGIS